MNRDDVADVVGEVLGELMGEDVVGARRRHRHHGHHGHHGLALPPRPSWRANAGTLPTGVNAPSEGLEPLPLAPSGDGTGTFSATVTNINYEARPQAPFQGERLLAQVLRTGTSAAGLAALCTGLFVGRELQQVQRGTFNLEFFAPTAFGVRIVMSPAAAGLDISMPVILSGALTSPDVINVQLLLLGHTIR
jgi:hypothetical protein